MKTPDTRTGLLGITLRTALLSWLVTSATLLIFVAVIIPQQKRTFLENLESKAHGVAVSLRDVAAGAAVNEDFSSVVDHCKEMLRGDEALDYLVIAKNDGFTLFHERTGWRSEPESDVVWRPAQRVAGGGIESLPPFNRRVFHYSQPFDYSGIEWGWIHVGLSLRRYDRSVAEVYQRTWVLAVLCIGLSLLASGFYARRLVRPILNLRGVVRKVAGGDLSARAVIESGDELGHLADSVNLMTEALLRRDRILHSVRFAAQQFLSTSKWDDVIEDVLAGIGDAAAVSRVYVFQNHPGPEGDLLCSHRYEWAAPGVHPQIDNPELQNFSYRQAGLSRWAELLGRGETLAASARDSTDTERAVLEPQGIRSILLIPIRVEEAWWGVLGLDECRNERQWTEAERDSLRAAADMLGAAIARQRTQDALLEAKEAAEAASRAKSQFLANMSHEIRTPITGVMGMLQLLRRTTLDDKQQRYVSNTLTSADALLKVIGDVLDFSKIEAGKLELEEREFTVPDVLDVSVRLLAEQAEAKGLEVASRVTDDVPRHLLGDPDRLQQVLLNLLSNAVKFTDRGTVILDCRVAGVSGDTTRLRFEVRDTGAGVAPQQQAQIFDAFCQADSSMSRNHGGTGLGLTISRQLVRLMNGQIGVDSVPGQGSTFWFTARFRRPADLPPGDRTGLVDFRGLRVLVVDDCPVVREIVSDYVRTWKGVPAEAGDGESALEKLRQAANRREPFGVAVLDWRMPGLDGFALAGLIKADPVLRGTGLVLLSGFTQASLPPISESAGFAAWLPKPARKSELYDAIIRAANGRLAHLPNSVITPLATRSRGEDHIGSGTILLAEDNDINQEVASELLVVMGYRCVRVRTGREAVDAVRDRPPDLVLMDCQMPEMDGYEATRRIRDWESQNPPAGPRGRRLPIVALTAHAMKGDRDRCLEAGMDDYLTKPLEPAELARVLLRWLPRVPASPTTTTPATAGSGTGAVAEPVPAPAPVPVSGPGATPAGIDFPSLLHRCMGNQDLAGRLLGKFAVQAAADLQELGTALAGADAARLRLIAHRLKGSAANVSAEAVRDLAGRLECAGRDNDLVGAPGLLTQLRDQVAAASVHSPSTVLAAPGATQPR